MLANVYEWIDIILAAFVGTAIMFVVVLLTAKPAKHDEQAAKVGGIFGLLIYRLSRCIGGLFKRNDPMNQDIQKTYNMEEARKLWHQEPDDNRVYRAADKDINEYPPEIQAIIKEEADNRRARRS
jgi:hypothetical protein